MAPQPKTLLVNSALAAGTYYLDNEAVSAEELCRRAEALEPGIRHPGTPAAIIYYQLGLGHHTVPTGLKPGSMDSFVTTHEAADALRRHGHLVTTHPTLPTDEAGNPPL